MGQKRAVLLAAFAVLLSAATALGQSISIVSGQGQVVPQNSGFYDPLVVKVLDATGKPAANQTVTWTVTATTGGGTVGSNPFGSTNTTGTSTTDANGIAQILFFQNPITLFGQAYAQSTVTASALAQTVTFYETSVVSLITLPGLIPATATIVSGAQDVTSQPGVPATPIVVQVSSTGGAGIPNVAVSLVNNDPNSPQTVGCAVDPATPAQKGEQPGTILTDSTGKASCVPVITGRMGSGSFQIRVGSSITSGGRTWIVLPSTGGGINYTLTIGPPSNFTTIDPISKADIGNDKQTGNANQLLPNPLKAILVDAAGNPIPNAAVVWEVVSGSATLIASRNATDTNGLVSTSVQLGTSSGATQIRVRSATDSKIAFTFTVNTTVPATGMQLLSGNNQSGLANQAFGTPLTVQVNNGANPVSGVTVTFAVTSGSATLNPTSAVTGANGQASTTVTAGATAGAVTITATALGFTQTFNLTVTVGPSNVTFVNGAGFQQDSISPCSVATIRGVGLAPGIQGVVTPANMVGPLPTQLANVTVQFGSTLAPIYSVVNSGGQESVTVQVPCDVNVGTVPVTIKVANGSSTVNANVQAVSPGIFEWTQSDNQRRAVLVRPDGSYVSAQNPARRGETIHAYVTGLGGVTPTPNTGQAGIPGTTYAVQNMPIVGVNNAGVQVVSATLAPNLLGVYDVAFVVPSDAPSGNNIAFAIAVPQGGNLVFGNPSLISIQ